MADVPTTRATQRKLVLRERGRKHERAPGAQGGREAPDEVGRAVAGQHPGRLERKVSAKGTPEFPALRVGIGRRLRECLASGAQGCGGHAIRVHVGREVERMRSKALLVLRHGATVGRERHRGTQGVLSTEPARTHVPKLPGDHLGAAKRTGGVKRLQHARVGGAYD